MNSILVRIKRAVLSGRFQFSRKAADEMDADGLTRLDIAESIMNADTIDKTIRSTSPHRMTRRETLYVIKSPNLAGLTIYTKGKLIDDAGVETYYFLVSAKHAD